MKKTFIYKEVNGCTIKGDLYPIHKENAPLLVYIHGGGLIWGARTELNQEQISLYHQAGFNVCSIDYRLAPETKLRAIATDIQDAIIWLQTEGAVKYAFDPERIAVIGSSAGAYLALLSGTFKVKPKVIVSFYGYGNILGDWYTKPSKHFLQMAKAPDTLVKQLIQPKAISEAPIQTRYAIYLNYRQQGKWANNVTGLDQIRDTANIKAYCPIENIETDYPATLLVHGDKDKDVPYEESAKMSNALSAENVKNRFITIRNGEHIFDQNMKDPDAIYAIEQVITFLQENL